MTLIVARISNNEFQILSDTKITDESEVRKNALLSNIKIFILNPKTCVAFAGSVHFAEKFLGHFYSLPVYNFKYILEFCLFLNKESNNSIEFGVSYINENEIIELYKVNDNKIESGLDFFWLGDKNAFEEYQKHFLTNTEDADIFQKMSTAFQMVIFENKIETVGSFIISAHAWIPKGWTEKILTYIAQSSAFFLPKLMNLDETKPIQYVPQGNAEDGGYSECHLRSLTLEYPAIAIHFYQGKFGILFCPALNYNHPIIINDQPDGKTFADYVKKKYNILLHGFIVENGSYFREIKGE